MTRIRQAYRNKPIIAITMGDYNGIGPEVTLKSVCSPQIRKLCIPFLVGSLKVYEFYARRCRIRIKLKEIEFFPNRESKDSIALIEPGHVSATAGKYAGESIGIASQLCLDGLVDGMVTAPVSKQAMHRAGYLYPGQTEMLAELTRTSRAAMMLVANNFRVGLATIHVPLKDVAKKISRKRIAEQITIIHQSLQSDFAIRSPKIAVLGLNPHAGENRVFGEEEKKWIVPTIRQAQRKKIDASGPFSADGFFGSGAYTSYDAVLAMYHDQGLIPLKMKGFNVGVNFTAGLPIVRTSPDHGTAFDIAGKGIADPRSMIEAIKLAVTIIKNRRKTLR
ncbi:MAG: 4-hydroxythreonine-4-phosphate dehydrogenase PdxA [Ignavibacteriae bacterium]|nr:4-hydroxythreonine-4-phosphate dehydrogenase PdxA [Ignavibacteriota bacterium]